MVKEHNLPECKIMLGNERFCLSGQEQEFCLLDFWRWSASDLVSNTTRGVLAEFIVAKALGIECDIRSEWQSCDLHTPSGIRIEVKSSAYLQSWTQKTLSRISFSISQARFWNAERGIYEEKKSRNSDCYVFCLLKEQDRGRINPLNLDQWVFYLIRTDVLDKEFPDQKTIGLKQIQRIAKECSFGQLRSAVFVNNRTEPKEERGG